MVYVVYVQKCLILSTFIFFTIRLKHSFCIFQEEQAELLIDLQILR